MPAPSLGRSLSTGASPRQRQTAPRAASNRSSLQAAMSSGKAASSFAVRGVSAMADEDAAATEGNGAEPTIDPSETLTEIIYDAVQQAIRIALGGDIDRDLSALAD